MKKLVLLAIVAMSVVTMSAQSVMRSGDTYYAEGMSMNKTAFAMHMQQNAEANLAMQFQNALKLSNTGWGLFGAGLGAGMLGGIISVVGWSAYAANSSSTIPATAIVGALVAAAGEGLTIAGIACLGVGYSRMHNAADTYIYQRRAQVYLSIKADQNGLGLALNF